MAILDDQPNDHNNEHCICRKSHLPGRPVAAKHLLLGAADSERAQRESHTNRPNLGTPAHQIRPAWIAPGLRVLLGGGPGSGDALKLAHRDESAVGWDPPARGHVAQPTPLSPNARQRRWS